MAVKKSSIKKTFFEVNVPMTSTKVFLYGSSADMLVGKVVKIDLTRTLRGKSLELRFRVKKEGSELTGTPISLCLVQSYIRRMMRNRVDYCEDSFKAECKDGSVTIKPFMITRLKVSRSVLNALRKGSREFIESYLKGRNISEVFSDITTNKIQRELSFKLKKIYPLALCEIKSFEVINSN